MSKRETKKYDANIVLYNMCKDDEGKIDDIFSERLAGKIWLIGRSYAASPERRHYTFYENNNKIERPEGLEIKTSNADGTSGFFDAIAENMKKNENARIVSNHFDYLQKLKGFRGDYRDDDILSHMVQLIYYFNKILVEAIEAFDKKDKILADYNEQKNTNITAKCNNFISFCSKFMHFHLPNVVFIYDSYSYAGGKKWIKDNYNGKPKYIEWLDDDIKTIMSDYNKYIFNAYNALVKERCNPRKVDNLFLEQNKK